jgi:predicted nucleic acid-binding protein
MKIIIDTNILVSAIIRDNLPEQLILSLLAQPAVEWIATTEIVMEYLDVLQRKKFNLPADVVAQWRCLMNKLAW